VRVVELVEQLREAELDEAVQPLADDLLLVDEGHDEAGGLAELDPVERIVARQRLVHGHLGERAGIGRIGLRPGEAALRKVLRPERVDHHDRHALAAEVAGERHPVVAGRLERDQLDRLGPGGQPGVEGAEPGPALGDPEDRPLGPGLTGPAARHRVALATDVDPDRGHPVHSLPTAGAPRVHRPGVR